MALKAVHVSDVPNLDHVPENPSLSLYSTSLPKGVELGKKRNPRLMVIGHRGNGMNVLQSSDKRMRAIKENSIASFNAAAAFPVDFIEFDVQVTKDDCPVIFHDDFILSRDNYGTVFEERITDLRVSEFLCYGPQKEAGKHGNALLRKTKDGKIVEWNVETDDFLCTLEEAFLSVEPSLGFNVELKFDDHIVYDQDYFIHVLQVVLQVFGYAKDRPIIFSSFHPDAALLIRIEKDKYPVFFLTNGGTEIFYDVRRNSLEEAIKVCLEGGLQGIVSEVKGVFRNPGAVPKIKDSKLSLLTYGKLNNVAEAVYMQHLMGIDGVIVDLVKEITESISDLMKPSNDEEENSVDSAKSKPKFTEQELSFLLKLIPELIQI
ncbi:glycerophosphodiester phosphodiesterase GDPD1, chloroplastic [Morus notabilis]|uniref:glycerophosphodiester phosphodiesterase GDPD1, chloroplastic n=1 Tax=Morus notabilis TaxID=981085 RepID=UPI000CED1485|nr:glycerophosphodiester phosphodiesterase GDPD1, chloroplastic [Morus notabilis]